MRTRPRPDKTVAWAMAKLLIAAGVIALGTAGYVAWRPVVNPEVQDCGSPLGFFLHDRANVIMRPGAPNAPEDPRRAVELEAQPNCRDRAATELARAGFAAAAFLGLTFAGIVIGLLDDRVALWRAPRFETYLRMPSTGERIRRGLVARVEADELARELPKVEATEVVALLVGTGAALVGLPFAATITTVGSVASSVRYGPLMLAVVFMAVAFAASAAQRVAVDPRDGNRWGTWQAVVVASSWLGGLRPLVAWFGVDLHHLRRSSVRHLPAVEAVRALQLMSSVVHVGLTLIVGVLWARSSRPVIDPRGPELILLVALVLVVGNGLTRLPARWRAFAVHPHWAWPRPDLLLAGATVVAAVVRGAVLLACLAAFGASAPFVWILLVSLGATAIGALGPFPNGAGCTEAAMMAGLVFLAGIDPAASACAALAARGITFWLPMIPGWYVARRIH